MKNRVRKITIVRIGSLIINTLTEYHHRYNPAGDIEEEYQLVREERGAIRAAFWYWDQILVAVIKHIGLTAYWRLAMLKSYLKIAFRNLKKQKGYAVINIAGLAVGMACCILILIWIQDEFSYDRFHTDLDRIHRIVCRQQEENNTRLFAVTPAPVAAAFRRDIPEIEKASMLGYRSGFTVRRGDESFKESRHFFVDADFFDIFSFPLIQGDPKNLFLSPYSIILTQAMAEKYFVDVDPIGRTLTIDGQYDVTVTGIIENSPRNSSLRYNFISPFRLLMTEHAEPGEAENWDQYSHDTYVKLSEHASLQAVNDKIRDYKKDNIDPESSISFFLQPLDRLHLHSGHITDGYSRKGDIRTIYLFSALALLILMIACINFINLMTARASGRAREVGLRKVVGAFRADIVRQFFGETVLLAVLAFFLALLLVQFALPEFNAFARKELTLGLLGNGGVIAGLIGIVLLTGLMSGSYPAVYISAFQPVQILREKGRSGSKRFWLRKILVVSQFALSIILIIAATVLSRQVRYIRSRDLGYNRENIISIPMPASVTDRFETIKAELLRLPDVLSVAGSGSRIPWSQSRIAGLLWEGCDPENSVRFNVDFIDDDYLDAVQIELIEGETFSKQKSDEMTSFILNEEAIRQMGLEAPVGKRFELLESGQIVGIVKDFIFDSFQNPIEPMLFVYAPSRLRYVHVRMQPHDIPATLEAVETAWKRVNPYIPFEYDFVDDDFEFLSRTEQRIGTIFKWSAGLGILISCLGLVGLASFVAAQRTKEIGIRKVLGSSGAGIFILMIREFLKWTLFANLIAWPVAWVITDKAMSTYAYRIDIGWTLFASAGALALLMAVLTVGYQAVRSALANPVDSLRYE